MQCKSTKILQSKTFYKLIHCHILDDNYEQSTANANANISYKRLSAIAVEPSGWKEENCRPVMSKTCCLPVPLTEMTCSASSYSWLEKPDVSAVTLNAHVENENRMERISIIICFIM